MRRFRFDYRAQIIELPAGASVRVWAPMPSSNSHQSIKRVRLDVPGQPQIGRELKYANKMVYFSTTAPKNGQTSFAASYSVSRSEVRGLAPGGDDKTGDLTAAQRKLFLSANRKVPITGKPLDLLRGQRLPTKTLGLAEVLYRRVDDHVRYDKSRPGYGQGDSLWVCDSRFGNCTDFHSLFISLARSQNIAAKFEIGFPLPPERGSGKVGGYHCWAMFFVENKGWVPVDISEADKFPNLKEYYFGNLTEDRVAFSVGRDINLTPRQASEPLNFFIYPHVEVNGQKWPQEKIKTDFAYADQE